MTELYDLSSDESFDTISSSNTDPSSTTCASSGQSSSSVIKYNTSNIKMFLREQPEKYLLVENSKVNHVKPSPCWNRFALPAVKDENDRSIIIKNFATCRSCYTTDTYTHGSTKSLNSHKCLKELSVTPSSSSFSIKSSSSNSKVNRFSAEK